MITILTILFMIFIWSLCRISKKQEPGIQKDSKLITSDEEAASDFNTSVDQN
ncbi:MAG TPA: hypothetical protein VEF33_07900 [Syntrophales bacterium]|nr:hypothetical protein [Syntrophales bacterium]